MPRIPLLFISVIFCLAICCRTVSACDWSLPPLRKEFRKANAVFTGKILKIRENYFPTELEKKSIPVSWTQGDWKDKDIFSIVTVEITKKWKGKVSQKQDFISVSFGFCKCEGMKSFEAGREYLFFASGKNFIEYCDADEMKFGWTKKRVKRLDSFWYRAWARIYAF